MKNLLVCVLISVTGFAMAEETLSEEQTKSIIIAAFPTKESKEAKEGEEKEQKLDVYVYSERELDNPWVTLGTQQIPATRTGSPSGTKLFTYKVSKTIPTEVQEMRLTAYDAGTSGIVTADFTARELEDSTLFRLTSLSSKSDARVHTGFDTRLEESSAGSGTYRAWVVTVLPLSSVQIKDGNSWRGVATIRNNTKLERLYQLPSLIKKTEGTTIEVRAKAADRTGFVQKLVLKPSESGELAFVVESKTALTSQDFASIEAEEARQRQEARRAMIFGGSQYSAQEVAQARAEHMATMGQSGAFHINWDGRPVGMLMGMIPTAQGPMWEGTGWGGGGTCSNGKQLVAEGRAGNYLVRFFVP